MDSAKTFVHALVSCRLDYNSLLAGITGGFLNNLQAVQTISYQFCVTSTDCPFSSVSSSHSPFWCSSAYVVSFRRRHSSSLHSRSTMPLILHHKNAPCHAVSFGSAAFPVYSPSQFADRTSNGWMQLGDLQEEIGHGSLTFALAVPLV